MRGPYPNVEIAILQMKMPSTDFSLIKNRTMPIEIANQLMIKVQLQGRSLRSRIVMEEMSRLRFSDKHHLTTFNTAGI